MYQQSYSIGGEAALRVHIGRGGGALHLIGSDESYLRVQGEGNADDYAPEYQSGDLRMDLREDCTLFVPRAMPVNIDGTLGDLQATELAGDLGVERAGGDVTLKSTTGSARLGTVAGDVRVLGAGAVSADAARGDLSATDVAQTVNVGQVSGDVTLRAVHGVELGNVHGDLRAVQIAGDFTTGAVNGDANLSEIAGQVTLGPVSGDARLADVGPVARAQAGGDLYVDTTFAGESPQFMAGGDVTLTLPGDTNAQLVCMAGGEIVNEFGGGRSGGNHATITLGEGGATVRVKAGGDIRIKPREGEAMEFRFEIHKEELRRAKDEMKRAKEDMRRVKREIREQMRAQKQEIRRTVHEDLAGTLRRSFAFGAPGFPFAGGPRPGGGPQRSVREAAPAKQGASEEERMEILKMLEQKRITTEQAEMLLAALGDE